MGKARRVARPPGPGPFQPPPPFNPGRLTTANSEPPTTSHVVTATKFVPHGRPDPAAANSESPTT